MFVCYFLVIVAYHLLMVYTIQMTREFKFVKQDCELYIESNNRLFNEQQDLGGLYYILVIENMVFLFHLVAIGAWMFRVRISRNIKEPYLVDRTINLSHIEEVFFLIYDKLMHECTTPERMHLTELIDMKWTLNFADGQYPIEVCPKFMTNTRKKQVIPVVSQG